LMVAMLLPQAEAAALMLPAALRLPAVSIP
jgi:hypothetical protein